jgi:uncharacterized membrane-anchored protein
MKVKAALAVALLQVLVLAFMAGQREWIARTGTPVVLRTAPIDPNDPMRGAYVRLNYEINFVPSALCRGETAKWPATYGDHNRARDQVVYAALQVNPYGIADLVALSDQPPASGPFLRGRVQQIETGGIRVRYGIEALFMNKAAAQRTEREGLEKAGAPMNVRVAVGSNGTAVLRDFAWEPLGITFAIDRPPRRENNDPQRWQPQPITGMTVTLHNYSDKDVAIVDRPEGGAFRLIPNTRMGQNHYAWAGEKAGEPTGAPSIIVLKPRAKHEVRLDFTAPRWWLVDTRKPGSEPIPFAKVPQGDVWNTSFRLEYAPPPAEAVRDLPHADLIRHAPLHSRAFNANQGVD